MNSAFFGKVTLPAISDNLMMGEKTQAAVRVNRGKCARDGSSSSETTEWLWTYNTASTDKVCVRARVCVTHYKYTICITIVIRTREWDENVTR